ncbi:hypothetical protein SV7mr_50340 [Stieleria bergensis]|uniref:Uncharacterized protein n=1 Tax=Stieleria bergensis TaxID=2528025 RepID=A0A517T298_9BACT|nr:hypothetical protein SV7mr_50340 [Planctomycetes bacterium SV_7m_r]
MKSKKTVVVLVVAITAILFCAALTNMHYISTPRLVIRFEGKPASNVTLILPDGGAGSYQLDGDGSITAREIGWTESLILLPKLDGGGVSVGFPQHGTKVIDFQGRMTTTTIVQYFGLVSEQFESFSLTDADIADIESGQKSSAEIVEEIRRAN